MKVFMQTGRLAWLFALFLFVLGCASGTGRSLAEDKPSVKGPPKTALSNDILNVGDKVRVVFDIPATATPPATTEMQIPEDGELTLHLGHKFVFKDKRRNVLEQEIRDFYIDKGLYRIINVTIEVLPRPITVGGEVRNPNTFAHQGQMTVLKAIDTAGGFTEFANRRKVIIIRGGKTITVNCKKAIDDPAKYDVSVFPGDSINVKRGW